MRIWYHGTNVDNAKKIVRTGFRAGTYFAEHLEDALAFGGYVVFEVALEHMPARKRNWQMRIYDPVPFAAVVSITHYHTEQTFENEELREKVFNSNR